MKPLDYIVLLAMSVVFVIGTYQFYFWCQRHTFRTPISLKTNIDSLISYHPRWIWIYSGLYYPVLLCVIVSIKDARHYIYVVFSYLLLLVMQIVAFILFPVSVPPSWRALTKGNTLSEKFLKLVHRFDAPSNCFPSMHVSVATLTSLHLVDSQPNGALLAFVFPVLIAISAVYTKQHFILDLPPGAVLGWLAFKIYIVIYP